MGDCDAGDSAPSVDCSSAPDTSMDCSSSAAPPPDYSTSVSHSETGSSNHHSATMDSTHHSHHSHPISDYNASEVVPLKGIHHHAPVTSSILHGTTSSAPFLDESPESHNRHDGYVSGSDPYNPQPSFNPSYMADRPTTPRPNVYGKKTIVLTRTDGQMSKRKRQIIISVSIGVVLSVIILVVTMVWLFAYTPRYRRTKVTLGKSYNHETNNDLQYDGRVFNTPRHTTANPYLIDNYKSKYDDTYGSDKNSDTLNNPFLDHKYKDTVTEKPWKPKTNEDILHEMGVKVPDFYNPFEDPRSPLRNGDSDSPDRVIPPISMSDDMKDRLGIPRDEQTTEKKSPIWK